MTQISWPVTGLIAPSPVVMPCENGTGENPTHWPQNEISPYGDRIRSCPPSSMVLGTENLHCANAVHPLPHTTPPLDVAHRHDCFQLPHPLSAQQYDDSNPLPHLRHSLSPAENEHLNGTHDAYRYLDFSRLSELYKSWGSFYLLPDLLPSPNISPHTVNNFTSDSTTYLNPPCHPSPWSGGDSQPHRVDEIPLVPSDNDHTLFPVPASGPSLGNSLESYSGPLEVSYPCQWTKNDVTCNVMVQATRSNMNRHLHLYHGFGGSDARQTKCHWVGCGAMMQQGSIARHAVTCHLQAKVTCPMCSKKLSRRDVISKHQRVCPAASKWS